VSETTTMAGTGGPVVPVSGATMLTVEAKALPFFLPASTASTLLASMLTVTMLSPPLFETSTGPRPAGGGTVNSTFVDGALVERDGLDLETLEFQPKVFPFPVGFRLAEVPYQFPPADPDLLSLGEE
jgi:hypothetical protein